MVHPLGSMAVLKESFMAILASSRYLEKGQKVIKVIWFYPLGTMKMLNVIAV